MWKIAVGFAIFAGLALYVISQGGDNIDMTGEKHGAEAVHVPAPAEAPAAPAAAPASHSACCPCSRRRAACVQTHLHAPGRTHHPH